MSSYEKRLAIDLDVCICDNSGRTGVFNSKHADMNKWPFCLFDVLVLALTADRNLFVKTIYLPA